MFLIQERVFTRHFSSVDSEFLCPICLEAMKDIVLTSCGHHFCEACLTQHLASNPTCPLDRSPLPSKDDFFRDKAMERKMGALQIVCPNKCDWNGSLSTIKQHIATCPLEQITCCLGCNANFIRKEEEFHKISSCPKRKVNCEHCSKEINFEDLEEHFIVCSKFPIKCKHGCVEKFTRENETPHYLQCPLQIINCQFKPSGCQVALPRHKMENHLQVAMNTHLLLLQQEIIKMNNGFQEFTQVVLAQLQEQHDLIKQLIVTKQVSGLQLLYGDSHRGKGLYIIDQRNVGCLILSSNGWIICSMDGKTGCLWYDQAEKPSYDGMWDPKGTLLDWNGPSVSVDKWNWNLQQNLVTITNTIHTDVSIIVNLTANTLTYKNKKGHFDIIK